MYRIDGAFSPITGKVCADIGRRFGEQPDIFQISGTDDQ
jgi:hypothetical protein